MNTRTLAMALTFSLALLAPALAQDVPVGNLEVPGNGSFQSGIGFISGWVCDGEVVEVVLNGDQRLPVTARGLARGDTEAACGDQNNGFLTIWNWNLMGEGTHTAALVVDGQTLRRHSFTVTTLGEEFVRDVEKDVTVEDFPGPGETVTLRWQQPVQNFVIVPSLQEPFVPASSSQEPFVTYPPGITPLFLFRPDDYLLLEGNSGLNLTARGDTWDTLTALHFNVPDSDDDRVNILSLGQSPGRSTVFIQDVDSIELPLRQPSWAYALIGRPTLAGNIITVPIIRVFESEGVLPRVVDSRNGLSFDYCKTSPGECRRY